MKKNLIDYVDEITPCNDVEKFILTDFKDQHEYNIACTDEGDKLTVFSLLEDVEEGQTPAGNNYGYEYTYLDLKRFILAHDIRMGAS